MIHSIYINVNSSHLFPHFTAQMPGMAEKPLLTNWPNSFTENQLGEWAIRYLHYLLLIKELESPRISEWANANYSIFEYILYVIYSKEWSSNWKWNLGNSRGNHKNNNQNQESNRRKNKAVYTATEVACGWAGAVITGRPRAICGQRYPLPCFAWLRIAVKGSRASAPKGTKSCRTQGDFCDEIISH